VLVVYDLRKDLYLPVRHIFDGVGAMHSFGCYTSYPRNQWVKGCEALGIDSVEKIKKKILPILDPGFIEQDDFKEFYKVTIDEITLGCSVLLQQNILLN
jgi:hypothetical protein